MTLLADKQEELENIRKQKVKGFITRTRLQWLDEGEKPTSYFCNLEKINYVEKTMKKIQMKNGKLLMNQREILEDLRQFYSDLFEKKDKNKQVLISPQIASQVTKICCTDIGGEINISELSTALKNTKNNKTPGIDGIPADFLKVFWSNLKIHILNALNTCYRKGKLSVSLRQSVITCLPKGSKDRKLIQNWRPISLLCSIYKLASAVIANRLKPHLEYIISKSQSGFIKGRRIEESTRLVYDVMSYAENKKIGNFNYLNVAFISYKLTMWDLMLISGCHTRGQRLRKKDRSC